MRFTSLLCVLTIAFSWPTASQDITNKLGTNGSFIVTNSTSVPTYFIVKNSSGNVGIGSNTFDAVNPEKLLIDAGVTTSVNAVYTKGTINNYFQFNIRNLSYGNQSSSDIVATANNGTETTNFINLGINGSGFVYQPGNPLGPGKFNDCYLLAAGNDLYICDNNASKDIIFLVGGTSNINERLRIKYNGRIGIGTSTPSNLLSLSGGAYSNGTTWSNASDSSLKRNIENLTKYGLSDVIKMRPVSYYYKSDSTNKMEIGFIAQEMRDIIPEVVSGEDGDMGISYGNLVPVLVNSIKEQQVEIDKMKEDIKELKSIRTKSESADNGPGTIFWLFFSLITGSLVVVLIKRR